MKLYTFEKTVEGGKAEDYIDFWVEGANYGVNCGAKLGFVAGIGTTAILFGISLIVF